MTCPSRDPSGIGAIQLVLPVAFCPSASGISARPHSATSPTATCTERCRRRAASSHSASGTITSTP
ncbi:MAG: hypothetical protein ACXVWT_09495 [Solirubrobacteraceae bacterium]